MNMTELATRESWFAGPGNSCGFSWAEYQEWTQWMMLVQKVPRVLHERPFSWQCRAFLGKWMVAHGRMPEGIRVLTSVVDASAGFEPSYLSDGEELAWCLKELGIARWWTERNAKAALIYLEKSLRLIEAVPGELNHISRGEVWGSWLMLLENAGRGSEAEESVGRVLRDAGTDAPGKSRSYVFFACWYKACQAMGRGDEAKAARFMQRGLTVYAEPEYAEQAVLFLQNGQVGAAWQEYERLRQQPNLVWDDDRRPKNWRQKSRDLLPGLFETLRIKRKGGVLGDGRAV